MFIKFTHNSGLGEYLNVNQIISMYPLPGDDMRKKEGWDYAITLVKGDTIYVKKSTVDSIVEIVRDA